MCWVLEISLEEREEAGSHWEQRSHDRNVWSAFGDPGISWWRQSCKYMEARIAIPVNCSVNHPQKVLSPSNSLQGLLCSLPIMNVLLLAILTPFKCHHVHEAFHDSLLWIWFLFFITVILCSKSFRLTP